ncbi:hypothetical protein IAU59_007535 [Kwoniella sp. CBS 9459]
MASQKSEPRSDISPTSSSSEDFTKSHGTATPPYATSEKGVAAAAHYTAQPVQIPDGTILELLDGIPPLAEGAAPSAGSGFGRACLRMFGIGKTKAEIHGNSIATQPSVFDTAQKDYYVPKSWYEGYAAFDPTFRWTWKQEQRVTRIIDWKIFLWIT